MFAINDLVKIVKVDTRAMFVEDDYQDHLYTLIGKVGVVKNLLTEGLTGESADDPLYEVKIEGGLEHLWGEELEKFSPASLVRAEMSRDDALAQLQYLALGNPEHYAFYLSMYEFLEKLIPSVLTMRFY